MFKLKDKQWEVLNGVNHATFQSASVGHWDNEVKSCVPAQSVCWLFCWAKTGEGSPEAKQQAENLFNQVFADFKFADFDKKVTYQWALDHRYDKDDCDAKLAEKLGIKQ